MPSDVQQQRVLARIRLSCELALPPEETVESLLRLVLGTREEASPFELEVGLRSLGLSPTPLEIQQLFAMFGVPRHGTPCVDLTSLIGAVLRARVAPPRQLLPSLGTTEAGIRGPMPGPFATHPGFGSFISCPPAPRAEPAAATPTPRPSTAGHAAGLRRADLSCRG